MDANPSPRIHGRMLCRPRTDSGHPQNLLEAHSARTAFPPKRAPNTRLLQQSLTRYFGRPNSYDFHSDSALRAALQKSSKHKTKMRSGATRGGHSRAGK
jgi:hypothetical protein